MGFEGKTAVVTGSAKGIGLGCAELLAQRGANVVIADIDLHKAQKLEQELTRQGFKAKAVQVDVSCVDDLQKMVDFAAEQFGGIDILINNAGIFHPTPIEDITEGEWEDMMNVNVKSVFFATQKALPYLKKRGGKVVNLSSLAGRNGGKVNGLGYSAAKAAIIGLTRGFASRLAEFNINVNAVAPGSTDTGILDGIGEEKLRALAASIPLGRFGTIEEIAACVVFLCSDEAAFATGAVLDVNGGIYFG